MVGQFWRDSHFLEVHPQVSFSFLLYAFAAHLTVILPSYTSLQPFSQEDFVLA